MREAKNWLPVSKTVVREEFLETASVKPIGDCISVLALGVSHVESSI